jgi:hypothetical protein
MLKYRIVMVTIGTIFDSVLWRLKAVKSRFFRSLWRNAVLDGCCVWQVLTTTCVMFVLEISSSGFYESILKSVTMNVNLIYSRHFIYNHETRQHLQCIIFVQLKHLWNLILHMIDYLINWILKIMSRYVYRWTVDLI